MNRRFIILSLILAAACFYKIYSDKKINWHESLGANKFEATFSYFNGKKEIPIFAQKGQLIVVNYLWDFDKGTVGISILDPSGKYSEIGSQGTSAQVRAENSGAYSVIIYGEKTTNGHLKMGWELR